MPQEATREPARRWMCWRTRAVRKGRVAVGDAAPGECAVHLRMPAISIG